ncbi:hypothetical protein STUTZSP0542_21270 [Stutzerimonas marianensis]
MARLKNRPLELSQFCQRRRGGVPESDTAGRYRRTRVGMNSRRERQESEKHGDPRQDVAWPRRSENENDRSQEPTD